VGAGACVGDTTTVAVGGATAVGGTGTVAVGGAVAVARGTDGAVAVARTGTVAVADGGSTVGVAEAATRVEPAAGDGVTSTGDSAGSRTFVQAARTTGTVMKINSDRTRQFLLIPVIRSLDAKRCGIEDLAGFAEPGEPWRPIKLPTHGRWCHGIGWRRTVA